MPVPLEDGKVRKKDDKGEDIIPMQQVDLISPIRYAENESIIKDDIISITPSNIDIKGESPLKELITSVPVPLKDGEVRKKDDKGEDIIPMQRVDLISPIRYAENESIIKDDISITPSNIEIKGESPLKELVTSVPIPLEDGKVRKKDDKGEDIIPMQQVDLISPIRYAENESIIKDDIISITPSNIDIKGESPLKELITSVPVPLEDGKVRKKDDKGEDIIPMQQVDLISPIEYARNKSIITDALNLNSALDDISDTFKHKVVDTMADTIIDSFTDLKLVDSSVDIIDFVADMMDNLATLLPSIVAFFGGMYGHNLDAVVTGMVTTEALPKLAEEKIVTWDMSSWLAFLAPLTKTGSMVKGGVDKVKGMVGLPTKDEPTIVDYITAITSGEYHKSIRELLDTMSEKKFKDSKPVTEFLDSVSKSQYVDPYEGVDSTKADEIYKSNTDDTTLVDTTLQNISGLYNSEIDSMNNVYQLFNNLEIEDLNLAQRNGFSYIFITRPQLNLNMKQIEANSPDLYYLLRDNPMIHKMLAYEQTVVDDVDYKNKLDKINIPSPFIPILTNYARSLTMSDSTLKEIEAFKDINDVGMNLGGEIDSALKNQPLTISFGDTRYNDVINLFTVWVKYRSHVYKNVLSAHPDFIKYRILDYTAGIYVINTLEDGTTINSISKYTYVTPTTLPGSSLGYKRIKNRDDLSGDISMSFNSAKLKINDMSTIADFNRTVLSYPTTDLTQIPKLNETKFNDSLMHPGSNFIETLVNEKDKISINKAKLNTVGTSIMSGTPIIWYDKNFSRGSYKTGRYVIKFLQN